MKRTAIVLASLLLLACGAEPTPAATGQVEVVEPPSADPPAEPEPPKLALSPEQTATELLDRVDALAELHRRHTADCPALAKAMTDFHAQHGAALANAPAEALAHIDANEPLRARMRTAMEAIMSASMACRDDPAFAAAGATLFGAAPK